MSSNIDTFINAKNTDPRLIINPDSVMPKSRITFHNYNNSLMTFQTLDGRQRECRVFDPNANNGVALLVNNTRYQLEKAENIPLFTFDSRIVTQDKQVYLYHYIALPDYNRYEEKITKENGEDTDYPFDTFYCVFNIDDLLRTKLNRFGFNISEGFDCSSVDNLKMFEWKFRSKTDMSNYMSIAYYERTIYDCLSHQLLNPLDYFTKTNLEKLSCMHQWIKKVFPQYIVPSKTIDCNCYFL